jgi:WD40 repeat protein
VYSIETGEFVRNLDDNKDGSIVGYSVNPDDKKTLIACTENGTVLTWKLDSLVIAKKLVRNL